MESTAHPAVYIAGTCEARDLFGRIRVTRSPILIENHTEIVSRQPVNAPYVILDTVPPDIATASEDLDLAAVFAPTPAGRSGRSFQRLAARCLEWTYIVLQKQGLVPVARWSCELFVEQPSAAGLRVDSIVNAHSMGVINFSEEPIVLRVQIADNISCISVLPYEAFFLPDASIPHQCVTGSNCFPSLLLGLSGDLMQIPYSSADRQL